LKSALLAPLAAVGGRALAAESAAQPVFDAVDELEAEVLARLRAVVLAVPACSSFAASLARDYERHRRERDALRRRLRLPAAAAPKPATGPEASLAGLREALQGLVAAHAEGLPALRDARSVDVMARHMVDLSRHLTVVELWIELEDARG
jgi:hypothetical protein